MTHYLMAVNFIDGYKWNGIEKEEPFVDVTIHGIGPDVMVKRIWNCHLWILVEKFMLY